jgi:hypothetical protein
MEESAATNDAEGSLIFMTPDASNSAPTEKMRIGRSASRDVVAIGDTDMASGPFQVQPPAAEAIVAASTITANGCGTMKPISSVGNVTTDTTDTFSIPAEANDGCCMDVVNVDTVDTITLDNNAHFFSAGAADVVLGPGDSVRVCSNGSAWYQIGATGNN